jgi:hypothetical protein
LTTITLAPKMMTLINQGKIRRIPPYSTNHYLINYITSNDCAVPTIIHKPYPVWKTICGPNEFRQQYKGKKMMQSNRVLTAIRYFLFGDCLPSPCPDGASNPRTRTRSQQTMSPWGTNKCLSSVNKMLIKETIPTRTQTDSWRWCRQLWPNRSVNPAFQWWISMDRIFKLNIDLLLRGDQETNRASFGKIQEQQWFHRLSHSARSYSIQNFLHSSSKVPFEPSN